MKTTKCRARVLSIALLAISMPWFLNGKTAMAKTYHLLLSGDVGASFNGTCTIATSGGETVLTLKGQIPHEQQITGQGLSCKLEASGRVVVDVEHDGSRTRSSTNGGKIKISLR